MSYCLAEESIGSLEKTTAWTEKDTKQAENFLRLVVGVRKAMD